MASEDSLVALMRALVDTHHQLDSRTVQHLQKEVLARDDCVPSVSKFVETSTRGGALSPQRAQVLLNLSTLAGQLCTDTGGAEFRRLASAQASLLATLISYDSARSKRCDEYASGSDPHSSHGKL